MTALDEETIDVMNKVKNALTNSVFKINSFTVSNTMAGGVMIEIDIRKHEEEDEE